MEENSSDFFVGCSLFKGTINGNNFQIQITFVRIGEVAQQVNRLLNKPEDLSSYLQNPFKKAEHLALAE